MKSVARGDVAHWQAVGFDLDGTLFDHRGSAAIAVRQFTIDLGREPTDRLVAVWFDIEAEHFEHWRTGSISFGEQRRRRLRAFLHLLAAEQPSDVGHADALFEQYLAHYRRSWRAFPDAAPTLAALRARGVRIGVLTNGNHAQQLDKLETIGLAPLIDAVCTSEEIGVTKPDPRAFKILASRLGSTPANMAFVGDNLDQDIAGARAAGMCAGLVQHDSKTPVKLDAALRAALDGRDVE
ncbi:HAD-IA family hydrolase [Agrococcus sp. KRD186]|uniref:HAD-IA family hydrolase n=1 Tax=Agrococcus sp. KRD186 TaxID=2729730 RepID=UPI0019D1AAA4